MSVSEVMAHSDVLEISSGLLDKLRKKLMDMEIGQTDDQICQYLSLKWALARALRMNIEYLAEKIKIQLTAPIPIRTEQEMKLIKDGHAARKEELRTILGEITLINCLVVNCPTDTNPTNQND
ncbi:hypothetical protein TNCV_2507631 [Trichonephila clavipes]|nr:hypothetical protein TNCV_2507631 [Trichonephila clavipes]